MPNNEGVDLSKIVNIIMENPKIIEEISGLLKNDKEKSAESADTAVIEEVKEESRAASLPAPTYTDKVPERSRRRELLGAIKPYLSGERARTLDSVLSIVEILDLMKER